MTHISLQFGQCGNQLGVELFSLIYEDISHRSKSPNLINDSYRNISLDNWFYRKGNSLQARAILIDTEDKVVNEIRCHPNWSYNPENIVINNSGGSANNWGNGYNIKGPKILDSAIESLRKECEKCDRLQGFLSINSSAGGTGSGICSHFIEHIQNEFSNKTFISVLILPYAAGEVVTQNYNTLFTLSKLNNISDAIMIFQNDHIHNMLRSGERSKTLEFKALNRVIAEQIASVFQPISNHNTIEKIKFSEFASHLCAHPQYKLLSIKTTPQVINQVSNFEHNFKWNSLQHCEIDMFTQKYYRTKCLEKNMNFKIVANMLVSRGKPSIIPLNENKISPSSSSLYSNWSLKNSLIHYTQSRKYLRMEQYVTFVTNNSLIQPDLNCILESAWISFINNAFIYLYEKHDVTKEDFLEAFFNVETINQMYKTL